MAAFSTFLRFLKWKIDGNGRWKMETGFITLVCCQEAVSRFAKWPFREFGLSNASYKRT